MTPATPILFLFILALPIACVSWTVTHEELFRETHEYCVRKSRECTSFIGRKFYYLFTCEYCFSHYVSLAFVLLTRYQLLYPGWRGYVIGEFALVWVSNQYISIYNRLRLTIRNERVEMLSDGVFAIVVTLLVLELRVPHIEHGSSTTEMLEALYGMRAKLVSFVLSFVFVINLWFSHTVLFRIFIKIDNVMLWLNNLLLLIICFIPFPTAMIGEYPQNVAGMILFGIPWILIPLIFYTLGSYARAKKNLTPLLDHQRFIQVRKATLMYIPVVLGNMLISIFNTNLAFCIYIFLLVLGIILGFRVRLVRVEAEELEK